MKPVSKHLTEQAFTLTKALQHQRMHVSREYVRQLGDRAIVRLHARKGWLEARAASRRSA